MTAEAPAAIKKRKLAVRVVSEGRQAIPDAPAQQTEVLSSGGRENGGILQLGDYQPPRGSIGIVDFAGSRSDLSLEVTGLGSLDGTSLNTQDGLTGADKPPPPKTPGTCNETCPASCWFSCKCNPL